MIAHDQGIATEPGRYPRAKVLALTGMLTFAAVVLLAVVPDPMVASTHAKSWYLPMTVVAFILSERLVFHIEARNEAVSISPSDVPLAFGVVMLSPLALIGARLIGAAVALIAWRRPPAFKLAFNLASFTVESLVAVTLFRLMFGTQVDGSLLVWAGLVMSMAPALFINGTSIAIAISFFEGRLIELIATQARHTVLFYIPGAVLGASVTVPTMVAPWQALLFVIPAPFVWLVLRNHGTLMHQYSDLSDIHDFSSHIARSPHLEDIANVAVREIAGHLRSDAVAIVIWSADGPPFRIGHVGSELPSLLPATANDPLWADALSRSHPVTIDVEAGVDALADHLSRGVLKQAMVVTLYDSDGPLGVLVAADRHGAVDHFSSDDAKRLKALSQQLVVALRKGQMHLQIQHEATHDRLTGLPNRAYFEALTGQLLDSRPDDCHAVMLIDLDRFKEVNDTFGHQAGDQMLVEVTRRLQGLQPASAVPFRFGGDEFAVLVESSTTGDAVQTAEELSDSLEQPFRLQDASISMAASIGIALSPDHGRDVENLIRRADLAMYDAKQMRRRYSLFADHLEVTDSVRLELLGDLRDCLANDGLDVEFQPKLDIRTDEIHSIEALARWSHAVRGSIPPDLFIPLAEQAGLIGELTRQILRKSLDAVNRLADHGHQVSVAVNASAQNLLSEDLPRTVAQALETAQVQPHRLIIEITETTMMGDDDRTQRTLAGLDSLGVKISVDDFGTGYSSLVNLRRLPVSELKIDRSFVVGMASGEFDDVIVQSTIGLGHNLGLSVVGEGVESSDQLERLRSLGCDIAQGYWICRPVPVAELVDWMATRGQRTARQGVRTAD